MAVRRKTPLLAFTGKVKRDREDSAVQVPFDLAERWGTVPDKPCPVQGTIQGWDFRSVVIGRARRFWLLLPTASVRQLAVAEGDELRITLGPIV